MGRFTHKQAVVLSLFCLCLLLALNGPIVQMAREVVLGDAESSNVAGEGRDGPRPRGASNAADSCSDETGAVGVVVRRVSRLLLQARERWVAAQSPATAVAPGLLCEGVYLFMLDAVLTTLVDPERPRGVLDQAPDIVVRAVRTWALQRTPNNNASSHSINGTMSSKSVLAVHGRSWLESFCTALSQTAHSLMLLRHLLMRASLRRLSARQMNTFVEALRCLVVQLSPESNASRTGGANHMAGTPSCLHPVWGHFAVCVANTFIWRLSSIGGKTRNNGVLYLAAGFRGLVYQVRKGTSFRKGWYPQHLVREAAQQHATNLTVMFLTYHDEDIYFLTRYRRDEREHLRQLLLDYQFFFLLHYSPSMVMPFGIGASFLGSKDPFACGTLLPSAPGNHSYDRGLNASGTVRSSAVGSHSAPAPSVVVADNPKKWYSLFPRMVPVPHSVSQEPELERLFKAVAVARKKRRQRQTRHWSEVDSSNSPSESAAEAAVLPRYEQRDARIVWRGATTGKYPAPYSLTDRCRMVRAFVDAQAAWERRNNNNSNKATQRDAAKGESQTNRNRTVGVVRAKPTASTVFWADVAFSGLCQGVKRKHIPSPLRKSMNLSQMVRFRVHLDVDGNTNSWEGLRWRLRTGMVVVKVQSSLGFTQWYYPDLMNGTHLLVVNVERVVAAAQLILLEKQAMGAKLAVEAERFASLHLTKSALDAAVHHAVKNVWWIGNDRDRKWNIRSKG